MIKNPPYAGWKHNLLLDNHHLQLLITLDVGPRILSCRLPDGPNLFKEVSEQLGGTGETEWKIRGGHRLWTAPEGEHSYTLDNAAVDHEILGDLSVRLNSPSEEMGWIKTITVTLAPDRAEAVVEHRIELTRDREEALAPWALTVMDGGGTALIPLPPKGSHPENLLPNQRLILWPYTDMADPRFTWGPQNLLVRQDSQRGPTKLGILHRMGWVAYHNHGCLFAKSIEFSQTSAASCDQPYPDMGVNFEIFTNEEMLELESLAPLTLRRAGDVATLREQWVVRRTEIADPASIDLSTVLPSLKTS